MSRRGRHEGSIHLRGDGRWCAVLELGAGHGKSRRRKYFYAATRREVQQKLKRAERDMEAGLIMSGPDQPVRGFLRSWLEESVKQSVRPRTHEAYDLNVRRAVPHIGALKMSKLTPTALQNCYSELLSSGLSNRSVEQCHAVLHKAFRQATLWGLIARNPADAVTAPRPVRSEMQTLTADQVEQFFDQTEGDYLHALWVLFVATGMRLGEATGLRWTDIDLGKGRVSIKRTLQRQRGLGLVMAEPKNARARRTVHVDEDTLACLRAHRVQQAEHRLQAGPGWKDHDLAFSTPRGQPMQPSQVSKLFHKALARAALPKLRIHDLRHTAATLLLEDGTHPKLVQDLLGHSTIALTLDVYSHVSPALHAEVATRMGQLIHRRTSS